MSQFSAAGKPPWARDALGQPGVAVVNNLGQPQINQGMLAQPGVANPTVYSLATSQMAGAQPVYSNQQIGLSSLQATMQQAAATMQQLPQPGIAMPTTLASSQVQTVSYPAPRTQVPPGASAKQRVFTGTVTKLHDNFGFVDEDVFFQTSCVKGSVPKVGDRVLVEASYNANMPFKWNATRIQVLPGTQQHKAVGGGQNQMAQAKPMVAMSAPGRMNQNPPPLMAQSVGPQAGRAGGMGGRGMGVGSMGGSSRSESRRDRDKDRSDRHSSPSSRSARRSSPRKRSRSPKRRSRSRSPRRSSPRRRVARLAPRYTVQIPKITLDTKEANVIALRSRYANMYIPSDFFNATFPWTDAFPPNRPFPLGHPCNFQVMHKEVDPIVPNVAVLEPPDADHLYSAKVMLLASPALEDLYHKSCAMAEDPPETRENFQHPTRLINFLVGLKGKEPMAIGGPWSPSLDGPNPTEDPRVLINTAIRTTRALTGIDLSACTQWFRFAEIRYHRPEEMHKGRLVPARVETVLIFLPDVWSCNPSRLEWDGLAVAYKRQLAEKYKEDQADETQEEEEDGGEQAEAKPDPTHYTELDPKTMKVSDLRRELEARSLASKGLKSQLIARLTKALKTEESDALNADAEEKEEEPKEEEKKENDEKDEEKKKREEEERKRREERERAVRERRYTLTGGPAILVHPSTTAKQGKFDCTNMSLSVLLDYRHDDNKEHTFEVSLFAELFNEMLMRDFGFAIYKALVSAPEKVKEDKKDKDKKDRDKKDKKEKDDKDKQDDNEKKDDKEKKDESKETKEEKDKDEKSEDSGEPAAKRKKEDDKGETPSKEKKDEEKKDEKSSKDEKEKESDKEKDEKKDDKKNGDDEDDDRKSTVSSRRSRDRDDRDRDSRRRKDKDKDKEKEKEKEKMYTFNPRLLLSFCYFDQSHTGYLQDKDTEEILHTLGLFLSRSQVKKLVSKVVSKEHVYYRKMTDRALEKKKEVKEGEEVMDTDGEKVTEVKDKELNQREETPCEDEELLGKGNKPLLPEVRTGAPSPGKRKKAAGDGNMVMYNGAMLDIASMVGRLDKSEKLKLETDAKLKDLQEEMDMLKDSCKSSEQNSQKVALELQELKKKLRDQRKATERAESDAKRYYESMASVKTNLSAALDVVKSVTEKTSAAAASSPGKGEGDVKVDIKADIKKEVNGD